MKVYIVVRGENYDGYSIYGVYTSRTAAEKKVQSLISQDILEWRKDKYIQLWRHGCDYIEIMKEHVEDEYVETVV